MSVRIEHAPRAVLETLQLERLQQLVARLRRVPRGEVLPEIETLADLRQIPFTVKDDLRARYPLGMLAVPREQLRRIHASSGTGGTPSVVAYTEHDLDVWSKVMARCMAMAGVTAGMVVHNAYGYGLFTGGLGFHQGAERLGAPRVPGSRGGPPRPAAPPRAPPAPGPGCTPPHPPPPPHRLPEGGSPPRGPQPE